MSDQEVSPFLEPFARIARFWADAARGAPTQLTQPILPDWSFLRIDEANSSAPATEQAIVAKESYGRQIGRVMDALAVLIERQPDADDVDAFKEFGSLKERVDAIKRKAASDRIERLGADLELLKRADSAGYEEVLAKLRSLTS